MAREVIEHDDVILWPNGQGFTPCSKAYATAHSAAEQARIAFEGLGERDEGYAAAYEAFHRAEAARDQLQGDGGHLGKSERF